MTDPAATRSFPSDSAALRTVRRWLETTVHDVLETPDLDDLALAVTEACANAIRHSGSSQFVVSIDRSDRCVEVTVRDEGIFEEYPRQNDPDDDAHRGLSLIGAVVDDLSIERGTPSSRGTMLRMRKCPD